MMPQIADELSRLYADAHEDGPPDAPEVLRAISTGVRRSGAVAVAVAELDEIAAEMGGPPWPP